MIISHILCFWALSCLWYKWGTRIYVSQHKCSRYHSCIYWRWKAKPKNFPLWHSKAFLAIIAWRSFVDMRICLPVSASPTESYLNSTKTLKARNRQSYTHLDSPLFDCWIFCCHRWLNSTSAGDSSVTAWSSRFPQRQELFFWSLVDDRVPEMMVEACILEHLSTIERFLNIFETLFEDICLTVWLLVVQ